jgi:hypothetical protein
MYERPRVGPQSASQHLFVTKRKKQRSGTRAMSIVRHGVDTSTQASGELEMNYSIAGEPTLAEDSELIPTMPEELGSSAART